MKRNMAVWLGALAVAVVCVSHVRPLVADDDLHSAIRPVPRSDEWWKDRHAKICADLKNGQVDLIFLGDSITQGWNNNAVWQKFYGPRNAVNMGIGGDRTQHVLWRLDNSPLEGLEPKLVVLMIGTNNSNGDDNTAQEIGDGITAIVHKLREKLPSARVLVLAIFPRGEAPNDQRAKNAAASSVAEQLADGKMIHYMDIGGRFTDAQGGISKDIMPDFLHLTPAGYQIWADAIEPKVAELLGEQ